MNNVNLESIVAISTPIGRGAISVVRMSGNGVFAVAKKMFSPFPSRKAELQLGKLKTEFFTDQAMCVFFENPNSYTGEDLVEFQVHGGYTVANGVLNSCIQNGCRLAESGEFTKRAFLNGKMNLSSVEGIMDMIDAESSIAVENGYKMLTGKLDEKIVGIQDTLTDLLAQIEVALDYPEEDLEYITKSAVNEKVDLALVGIKDLLQKAKIGKIVKNGVDVAIVGKTNVGKSSLLNRLVGFDRAIVTDIEGTTRDTLSQSYIYKDAKFNFIDTAGLRKTNDVVESMGIERSKQSFDNADIVLLVYDETVTNEYDEYVGMDKVIAVCNKSDLNAKRKRNFDFVSCSAKTGENIEELKEHIYKKVKLSNISSSDITVTNSRQIDCLNRAEKSLISSLLYMQKTLDCVTLDIREAWQALGEITGTTASEDIINRIFEKFCVGK